MRRRRLVEWVGALLAVPGSSVLAEPEQQFPDRPVRIVVAFAPGTGSDALARTIAPAMARELGQPVIIDNRSGAGGIIGTEEGAHAAPDGYTVTLGTPSTLLTHPMLHPTVRYRVERDFAAVAALARTAYAIVTANRDDAPHDLHELRRGLEAAAASFASAGIGTIGHLAAETLLRHLALQAVHVPYRGSGEALAGVVASQELFAIDTIAAAQPLIRAGRLRALAVTAEARASALPDVPTAAQAGIGFLQLSAWWGLLVPAATPPERIERLYRAAARAMADAGVRTHLEAQGQQAMVLGPAEFAALMRAETAQWKDFVRLSGAASE